MTQAPEGRTQAPPGTVAPIGHPVLPTFIAGAGVPPGGNTNEVLTKVTAVDQDVAWLPQIGVPLGGGQGALLTKQSDADATHIWSNVAGGAGRGLWFATGDWANEWVQAFEMTGTGSAIVTITRSAAGSGQGPGTVIGVLTWATANYHWQTLSKIYNPSRADMCSEVGVSGSFFYFFASGGHAPTQITVQTVVETAAGWVGPSFRMTMVGAQAAPGTRWPTAIPDYLTQAEADPLYLTQAEGDSLFLTPAEGNNAYAAKSHGEHNTLGNMDGRYWQKNTLTRTNSGYNVWAGGGWSTRIHAGGHGPDFVSGGDNPGTSWTDAYGKNWVNQSSRAFKENIEPLGEDEAGRAFDALSPVRFDIPASYNPREDGPLPEVLEPKGQFGFVLEDMQEQPALKSVVRDTGYVPDQIIPLLVMKIRAQEARLAVLEARLAPPPRPPGRR